MDDGSGGATALLGMDGFVVLAVAEHEGEWWLLVETIADLVGLSGLRSPGGRPWTIGGPCARPPGVRTSGASHLAQAKVALSGS